MRYVSFVQPATQRASWGVQIDDGRMLDLQAAGASLGRKAAPSLLEHIREGLSSWDLAQISLEALRKGMLEEAVLDEKSVSLLAPIPRPPKNVFALGLNYADHVAELGSGLALPDAPVYFSKASTAVIGPNAAVVADRRLTNRLDWEVELGLVIGTGGRWIGRDRALDHIFGYTIVNDISARDLHERRPADQWFLAKSMDGFCPMGPVLVSAEEIGDPQDLKLALRVNGVEKQRSNTKRMIFGVAEIIADLSRYVTLEPGDVITTGTPSGTGVGRVPPEFLRAGDVMEAEIETIGVLRTPVTEPTLA